MTATPALTVPTAHPDVLMTRLAAAEARVVELELLLAQARVAARGLLVLLSEGA